MQSIIPTVSPGTDWEDIACYLGPNGNIFEDINFYVDSMKDSYGNKKLLVP